MGGGGDGFEAQPCLALCSCPPFAPSYSWLLPPALHACCCCLRRCVATVAPRPAKAGKTAAAYWMAVFEAPTDPPSVGPVGLKVMFWHYGKTTQWAMGQAAAEHAKARAALEAGTCLRLQGVCVRARHGGPGGKGACRGAAHGLFYAQRQKRVLVWGCCWACHWHFCCCCCCCCRLCQAGRRALCASRTPGSAVHLGDANSPQAHRLERQGA